MTNKEIALAFLRYYSSNQIDKLSSLLAPAFKFNGPFLKDASGGDYIRALKEDPPKDVSIELLAVGEEAPDTVTVFFSFSTMHVSHVKMAQLFKIRNEQIYHTLLIFDTAGFRSKLEPDRTTGDLGA